MIIYIDQLIISNVLVDYFFIKTIKVIFKEKVNVIRLVFAITVSILSLSLYFVSSKYIYNLRYFVGIIIGIIAFLNKDYKTSIIQIIIYYLLNVSFIGTLVIFNVNNFITMIMSLLFIVVLWIIESYKNISIKNKQFEYNVKINKLKLVGYYDSGNQTYCDGIPVVFMNNKYNNNQYIYYKDITVKNVNDINTIHIYKGPLLIVGKKSYYVYYSFIKSLEKDLILNYEMGD